MNPPRILLLEDDPRIALLVDMALEDLQVELVHCTCVADAEREIARAPVTLFITDLMLPGESGLSLLERLPEVPGYSPAMLTLAFSAGLSGEVRAQLEALRVWRVLSKPASMAALRACVQEAVTLAADPMAAPAAPPVAGAPAASPAHVEEFFGGDMKLFEQYRQKCRAQFLHDIADGDRALEAGDLSRLGLLAHSLKGVLGTLGEEGAAALASELERACGGGDAGTAGALWPRLRDQLDPQG